MFSSFQGFLRRLFIQLFGIPTLQNDGHVFYVML